MVSGSLMMAAGIFAMVIPKNILLGRIFNKFGLFFVLTGAFTNQALIAAGYELLIVPLDLILLGILLSFWGQFSSGIVRVTAYNLVLAGALGIWLTKFEIAHLVTYLIVYHGLSLIVMGYLLNRESKQDFVALLTARGSCDYNGLKKELGLSDGHMTTHMKELVEHAYVQVEKSFIDNKPRTTYAFNGCVEKKDMHHAQWLKREGEEFYFYNSADELIAQVLSITQAVSCSNGNNQEPYVLCPLSAEDNKFISRLCYTEVLNNSLEVCDSFGYMIPVKDGKRVIHFGKMSIYDAIAICEKIVCDDQLEYQGVKAWLEKAKQTYIC